MNSKKKSVTTGIKALSAYEYLQSRLFNKAVINPDYVVIGYLQEYFGGYSPDKKIVDLFFTNESAKASLLKKIGNQLLADHHLKKDIQLRKKATGHSFIESKSICKRLKKFYSVKEKPFLNHQRYRLSPGDDLFKCAKELYPGNEEQLWNLNQLSFLVGIFLRYKTQEKDALLFANAGHKVAMTIKFLNNFCSSGDIIRVEYHFNVPHVTRIRYNKKGPFMKGFLAAVNKYVEQL